ncbi:MAG: 3-polyprenyl-4-hydroxybenzoate decarboxylase, partial [Planctomycetota bacterium]
MEKSLVIAVTGASGVHYALRLLSHLERLDVHVDLLASAAGAEVLRREVDPDR